MSKILNATKKEKEPTKPYRLRPSSIGELETIARKFAFQKNEPVDSSDALEELIKFYNDNEPSFHFSKEVA